jgi:flagellar biosynthesis/type III secretory pathway M-ring protein FliF/YscJ
LPAEVFAPNQLEQFSTMTLIIVLVLFILAVVVLTWAFAKIIVPLISRLRNSQLIEEGGV